MEGMEVTWWMWILFGVILLLAEFLTPGGLFALFFGVGAVAVGLVAAIGLPLPLSVQLLLFLVFSLASLLLLRNRLRRKLGVGSGDTPVDSLEGGVATALEDIAAESYGSVELRGSAWRARNVGESPIARSQRCRVIRIEGLTLWIVPD